MKNVLHHVHCPVLVVPKKFNPIEKLVFLYDGSASSVHAIKMFNYILPGMSKLETKLLSAKGGTSSMHLADNKLIREWTKRHYPEIEYQILKGYENEIATMLKAEAPGILIVAGSYHRSSFSMWFHQSMADILMKDVRVPIFIAHT
jgi:nucleotide-binding universal stress UspA family protein